jgi:hypothetical protein
MTPDTWARDRRATINYLRFFAAKAGASGLTREVRI